MAYKDFVNKQKTKHRNVVSSKTMKEVRDYQLRSGKSYSKSKGFIDIKAGGQGFKWRTADMKPPRIKKKVGRR